MKPTRRDQQRWLARAGLIAILLIVAAAAAASMMAMRSMRAQPITAAELRRSAPVKPVDVAIEITAAQGARYSGRLLESSGKSRYRRTATALSFTLRDDVQLVMGDRADLRPGAVVMARGRLRNSTLANVDRVVMLTGYVDID